MRRLLQPHSQLLYAAMRAVLAFIYLSHGLQKLFGLLGGEPRPIASLMGAAGLIEVVGGTMIAVGLFTSYAAFVCSGQMAVAYFRSHYFRHGGGLPIENGGELAVVLCFAFLFIAARGDGKWSLGALLRRVSPAAHRGPAAGGAGV